MQAIWLSPTDYVTGDPTLQISYPSVSHPSTIVTCTQPGDLKWVSLGLHLPPNVSLEEVMIGYQVSNPQSFISQVRLVEMGTPEQGVVIHDDGTNLQSTTPANYSSHVDGKVPTLGTAVTLMLRLNFQNTTDQIMLGAVGVTIQSLAECVATIAALKALSAGVVPCLTVLGYHTPGDGGGGNFYWDASASEDDNAGTIVVPALNPPPVGRWKRLVDGPLSVKWFGAKGDAQTVDDGAINAAEPQKLSSASGGFAFGDVGKSIRIQGAGASGLLRTTIASYVSANKVNLTYPASTSTEVGGTIVLWGACPLKQTIISDGAMTAGSTELLTPSGGFAAGDVGEPISVLGAGPPGAFLTTIASYVSANEVILTDPAPNPVFGATVLWGTDDTAAIQATIAWTAGSTEGDAVYIPPGTYRIMGRLTFQDDASPPKPANGLTILGDGYASFLAFDHQLGDGHAFGFYGEGASNITIRDLRIGAMPGGAGFNCGIVFKGGSNITIRDNDISGAIYGILPDPPDPPDLPYFGYPSGIFLHGGVTDVRVLDNYLHDNGVENRHSWHIVVYATGGAQRVQIRGNRCITASDATSKANFGIGVYNSTFVEITGNYVEGIVGTACENDGYGIMLYGLITMPGVSHHHVVQGNTVKRTGGTGIYVQSSPYTTVTGNIIEDVAKTQYAGTLDVGGIGFNQGPGSITGNVIRNVGVGNTKGFLPFGIVIQTCVKETCGIWDGVARGITVSGNTIDSTRNYGIALKAGPSAAADNSTIIGNTLVNTRGGITTSGYDPISGLTIIGNSIIRTDKWLPQDAEAGIHLKATSNSTIASNVVTNSGGQGIILDPNSNRNVLSGNVVRNSGQHQANAYPGIQVTGTNNLIIGNESYNSGSGGISQSWGILESGANNEIISNNVNGNLATSSVGISATGSNTTRAENRLTADKRQGTFSLAGGPYHVTTMEVQAGDMILLSRLAANGTLGHLSVQNVVAGSFDVVSSSISDTSEVFWKIIH